MRRDLNCVQITGTLVRDPLLKALNSGSRVTKVSIATHSDYRTKSGEVKEVVGFFDIEAWGGLADILDKHFSKGKNITVIATLEQDLWKDSDNKSRSRIYLKITNLFFPVKNKADDDNDNRSSGNSSSDAPLKQNNETAVTEDEFPIGDDEVPF